MIKSQNKDIVDLYSQGKPVQKLYSKGELVWERGGAPADFHYTEIYLKIVITELQGTDYRSIRASFSLGGVVKNNTYTIDWGDGTIENYTSIYDTTPGHDYRSTGTFTVKATNLRPAYIFHGIMTLNSPFESAFGTNYIAEILNGTHIGSDILHCAGLFANNQYTCNKFNTIPQDIFKYTVNSTMLNSLFSSYPENIYLKSIPNGIFDNMIKLQQAGHTFKNCTSLTSIPTNLFHPSKHPNMISFSDCFHGCTEITSAVPPLWEWFPDAIPVECFRGCTKAANYAEIPDSWK